MWLVESGSSQEKVGFNEPASIAGMTWLSRAKTITSWKVSSSADSDVSDHS